ncbi:hypothetical protein EON81_17925 [bacterium]|nr:MAG: hypothetical protein EON81_17925 [bacterium]
MRAALQPESIELMLHPEPAEAYFGRFPQTWHPPTPKSRTWVEVTGDESVAKRIRLSIAGNGWNPEWAAWSPAVRNARELEGGQALDEQDRVSDDGQSWTVLVRAGEIRRFALDFAVPLRDGMTTGRRLFDVSLTDEATGESLAVLTGSIALAHPSSRLLEMLPSIYGEEMLRLEDEEATTPFFTRYLLGFEDSMKPIHEALRRMDELFGAYSTPPEYLLWLGGWVCLPQDDGWGEMKRRRLVQEAVELFRWRGTRRGLSRYLEIYTGKTPEIDDQPVQGMRLGPSMKLGAPETRLGDVPPHTFVVTVSSDGPGTLDDQTLHEIISFEKPAHTVYTLRIVSGS